MFKRYSLFLLTNILILLTVSLFSHFLGLDKFIEQRGINPKSILIFCLFWGFSGAFINLALSRWLTKRLMKVTIINANTVIPEFQALIEAVHVLSKRAGLYKMPEVGIYDSDEINAFATGPSRNRSLVAISTGLARRMNSDQIFGVLGHEISHIANGDMVTMTLLQGVINSFVMFFSRILSSVITKNEQGQNHYFFRYILTITFELIFGILGSLVVVAFSRHREFRADEGSCKIAGKENMIRALQGLMEQNFQSNNNVEKSGLSALKIYGKEGRFSNLFASHPPLAERLNKLQKLP